MPSTKMMKCGHAANAVCTAYHGTKFDPPIPCCAICDCLEIDETPPDLTGRTATCAMGCGRKAPSDPNKLAFFEHRPNREYDSYYCGCHGWD